MYSWGLTQGGRLGLDLSNVGDTWKVDGTWQSRCWRRNSDGDVEVLVPQRVQALPHVAHISGGAAHTLAATRDGRVYGWGDCSDHCLGLPGREEAPTPELYPADQIRVLPSR